jgi:hypothetical protein
VNSGDTALPRTAEAARGPVTEPAPAARPGLAGRATAGWPRRLRPAAVPAAWLAATLLAFAGYLRLASTRAVNSDGASQALQAWDMLHGNPLLRGWRLSDVSFYTTELPQYALIEVARGLHADVVHIAAAMTYTLAVLLAALLATGRATGRDAVLRALVAAGIMLAPQLGSGVNILVSSPDHIGTSVPVMLTWLILDRARPRWPVPVLAGALIAWAAVADSLVLFIGALPLALVSAARVYRATVRQRQPWRAQRYDLALGAAALAGAAVAMLALRLIRAAGGFYVSSPTTAFAADGQTLLRHLGIAVEGVLLLGGGDFLGMRVSGRSAILVLHLVGIALADWAVWLAARRFFRDGDRVSQLLVTGVVLNLAAYVLSTEAGRVTQTREIAAVLPLSAALAGRVLAGRLRAAGLVPLLAVVAAGYLAGLAQEISQPGVPAQNQPLTSWLAAHHLHNGLSGYWQANVVTLASGGRVRVRPVAVDRAGQVVPGRWEVGTAWYDPQRSRADFVVLYPGDAEYRGFSSERAVRATFGRPARIYRVGSYRIWVWQQNLLTGLG